MATASSYNLNPRSVTIEITDSLKLLRANSLCPQTGSLQGGDHPYGAVEHGQSKKSKDFRSVIFRAPLLNVSILYPTDGHLSTLQILHKYLIITLFFVHNAKASFLI